MNSIWIVRDRYAISEFSQKWTFSSKEKAEQAINNWIEKSFNNFEKHAVNIRYSVSMLTGLETKYFKFSWIQDDEEKEFEIVLYPIICEDSELPNNWEDYIGIITEVKPNEVVRKYEGPKSY